MVFEDDAGFSSAVDALISREGLLEDYARRSLASVSTPTLEEFGDRVEDLYYSLRETYVRRPSHRTRQFLGRFARKRLGRRL